MTEKHLDNVIFSTDKIGNVINDLDTHKAHGQDKIGICMLKIIQITCFGNSICKPLEII